MAEQPRKPGDHKDDKPITHNPFAEALAGFAVHPAGDAEVADAGPSGPTEAGDVVLPPGQEQSAGPTEGAPKAKDKKKKSERGKRGTGEAAAKQEQPHDATAEQIEALRSAIAHMRQLTKESEKISSAIVQEIDAETRATLIKTKWLPAEPNKDSVPPAIRKEIENRNIKFPEDGVRVFYELYQRISLIIENKNRIATLNDAELLAMVQRDPWKPSERRTAPPAKQDAPPPRVDTPPQRPDISPPPAPRTRRARMFGEQKPRVSTAPSRTQEPDAHVEPPRPPEPVQPRDTAAASVSPNKSDEKPAENPPVLFELDQPNTAVVEKLEIAVKEFIVEMAALKKIKNINAFVTAVEQLRAKMSTGSRNIARMVSHAEGIEDQVRVAGRRGADTAMVEQRVTAAIRSGNEMFRTSADIFARVDSLRKYVAELRRANAEQNMAAVAMVTRHIERLEAQFTDEGYIVDFDPFVLAGPQRPREAMRGPQGARAGGEAAGAHGGADAAPAVPGVPPVPPERPRDKIEWTLLGGRRILNAESAARAHEIVAQFMDVLRIRTHELDAAREDFNSGDVRMIKGIGEMTMGEYHRRLAAEMFSDYLMNMDPTGHDYEIIIRRFMGEMSNFANSVVVHHTAGKHTSVEDAHMSIDESFPSFAAVRDAWVMRQGIIEILRRKFPDGIIKNENLQTVINEPAIAGRYWREPTVENLLAALNWCEEALGHAEVSTENAQATGDLMLRFETEIRTALSGAPEKAGHGGHDREVVNTHCDKALDDLKDALKKDKIFDPEYPRGAHFPHELREHAGEVYAAFRGKEHSLSAHTIVGTLWYRMSARIRARRTGRKYVPPNPRLEEKKAVLARVGVPVLERAVERYVATYARTVITGTTGVSMRIENTKRRIAQILDKTKDAAKKDVEKATEKKRVQRGIIKEKAGEDGKKKHGKTGGFFVPFHNFLVDTVGLMREEKFKLKTEQRREFVETTLLTGAAIADIKTIIQEYKKREGANASRDLHAIEHWYAAHRGELKDLLNLHTETAGLEMEHILDILDVCGFRAEKIAHEHRADLDFTIAKRMLGYHRVGDYLAAPFGALYYSAFLGSTSYLNAPAQGGLFNATVGGATRKIYELANAGGHLSNVLDYLPGIDGVAASRFVVGMAIMYGSSKVVEAVGEAIKHVKFHSLSWIFSGVGEVVSFAANGGNAPIDIVGRCIKAPYYYIKLALRRRSGTVIRTPILNRDAGYEPDEEVVAGAQEEALIAGEPGETKEE